MKLQEVMLSLNQDRLHHFHTTNDVLGILGILHLCLKIFPKNNEYFPVSLQLSLMTSFFKGGGRERW